MEVTACMAIARGAKCAPHAAAYPATRVGADRAIAGAGRPPLFGAFAAFGQAKSPRRTSVRCTARIATSRVQIHRATSSSRPHTHFRLLCASRAAATARTHPPAATATAAARVVASPGSHPPRTRRSPSIPLGTPTHRTPPSPRSGCASPGMETGCRLRPPGTRESPSRGSLGRRPARRRSRPRPAGRPRGSRTIHPRPGCPRPAGRPRPRSRFRFRARGGRDVFGEAFSRVGWDVAPSFGEPRGGGFRSVSTFAQHASDVYPRRRAEGFIVDAFRGAGAAG